MNAETNPADLLPRRALDKGFSCLDGYMVLDLTTSLAGPYATLMLADFGASVIKIERPGIGDDSRYWTPPSLGDISLWFSSVNRNKKSVELDYTSPAGHDVLMQLVQQADVVVTNQLPRVRKKLNITYDQLAKVNPRLIYVSVTGFGSDNDRENWACYDLIAEGYSGVMDLTGEPDGPPQKVGTPAADLLAGNDAAMATLSALLKRERTGKGCNIDVSLTEAMTRFMTPRLYAYLGGGGLPTRSGGRDSVIAIYQVFDTVDDPITLGLANDNVWRRFCEIAGRTEWLENEAYRNNAQRVTQRSYLAEEIAKTMKQKTASEWLSRFQSGGVPAGPINRLDQTVQDTVMQERGFIYAVETENGSLPQIGLGIRMDGKCSSTERLPPALGEHTEEVLGELLQMDAAEIEKLKSET